MIFNFDVSNHSLSLNSEPVLFSGNENYYICSFNFLTPEWDNLLKFAVFTYDEGAVNTTIENGKCTIPSEALRSSGKVFAGVFGYNPDEENYIRISTNVVYLFVGQGGYSDADAPLVPTPDIWEKYYGEMTKIGGFTQRAEEAVLECENSADSAKQALSDLLKMLGTDIATLVDGKIPVSQIPSIATTEIYTAESLEDMDALSVQNGDICIRTDENKSYIYSDGWVFLVSPTDYASQSGYAETAGTAENAERINDHRLVEMRASAFETAVKDSDTYYLVY